MSAVFLSPSTCVAALPVTISNSPAWIELAPEQRTVLQPLQGLWVNLPTESKLKWLEIAERFPKMSQEQQARIHKRMRDWAAMTAADRDRARLQFQAAQKKLSVEELSARWEAYQALSPEEKMAFASAANQRRKPPKTKRASPASGNKSSLTSNKPTPPPTTAQQTAPQYIQAPVALQHPPLHLENPGVSTPLVTRPPLPPAHVKSGARHILMTAGTVDPITLLPIRGPQGVEPAKTAKSNQP